MSTTTASPRTPSARWLIESRPPSLGESAVPRHADALVFSDRTGRRSLGRDGNRLTVTDPFHVEAAARLRTAFGKAKPRPDDDLLRDLADYDRAFGVDLNADADRGGEVA